MRRLAGLSIAFLLATSLGLAAEEPAVDRLAQWEKAKDQERYALLKAWSDEAMRTLEADPRWKPGKEWQKLLARLAETPKTNPEMQETVGDFFQAVGHDSEHSVTFCEAVMQSKEGEPELNRLFAIGLLAQIGPRCDRARDLALAAAKAMEMPDTAYGYLTKYYGDDPKVKSILLTFAKVKEGLPR